MSTVEINISLDERIASLLQKRAAERQKPADLYVAELISEDARQHEEELAAEGYRLLSDDTGAFAAAALPLAYEHWPQWEDTRVDHCLCPSK